MKESRVSIIQAVQTPLGFFTLVVLVAELILGGLAVRATGLDFTLLIVGMIGLLFALVLAVFRMSKSPALAGQIIRHKRTYDVFFSSVLAGFNDDQRLLEEKEVALSIVACLEREARFNVYYAGREVSGIDDFDATYIGPSQDLEALKDSRYFLMLYPEKITSSVLFEAGYALDHCDVSIYLVHDSGDLPYLMRRLPEIDPRVRIIKFKTPDGIRKMIEDHRGDLFKLPEAYTSVNQ